MVKALFGNITQTVLFRVISTRGCSTYRRITQGYSHFTPFGVEPHLVLFCPTGGFSVVQMICTNAIQLFLVIKEIPRFALNDRVVAISGGETWRRSRHVSPPVGDEDRHSECSAAE